jgi:heme oxygenase (biliverdin-IX-beta and delta-forming)
MSARTALRAETRDAHERVDALFGRFDLGTRDGYAAFLATQASAFLPVEAALDAAGAAVFVPDWPERRRGAALRADLADLSVTAPELSLPPPHFPGKAPVLGALYVIEGSRLGGALLKRALPAAFPRRFLDARQAAGSWRRLLELIERDLFRPEARSAAIAAACAVFERFARAAETRLEDGTR